MHGKSNFKSVVIEMQLLIHILKNMCKGMLLTGCEQTAEEKAGLVN